MGSGNTLRMLTIPLSDSGDTPLRETDAAYGIEMDGGEIVWFPKSQIQEFKQGDGIVSFWCPDWLIEAKGVEDFIDTSFEPSLFE
jgi:hypothetical protein